MGTPNDQLVVKTVELSTVSDIVAIILGIVALFITIIGFFASLKFYRDGVALQNSANEVLTKLNEKANFIQARIDTMFEKTLDAAIAKSEQINVGFDPIDQQVEKAAQEIVDTLIHDLGEAGEKERKNVEEFVNKQLELVKQKINDARVYTEQLVLPDFSQLPASKFQINILEKIVRSTFPLTIEEIATSVSSSEPATKRALDRLIKRGLVVPTPDGRQFAPTSIASGCK